MRIGINIPNQICEELLKYYGYTSEKLSLYYDIYRDYDCEILEENLRAVESTVAYPSSERPEVLNSKFPLVDNCAEIMYDTVVERLFNKRLLEVMFDRRLFEIAFDDKRKRPHTDQSRIHYK